MKLRIFTGASATVSLNVGSTNHCLNNEQYYSVGLATHQYFPVNEWTARGDDSCFLLLTVRSRNVVIILGLQPFLHHKAVLKPRDLWIQSGMPTCGKLTTAGQRSRFAGWSSM